MKPRCRRSAQDVEERTRKVTLIGETRSQGDRRERECGIVHHQTLRKAYPGIRLPPLRGKSSGFTKGVPELRGRGLGEVRWAFATDPLMKVFDDMGQDPGKLTACRAV